MSWPHQADAAPAGLTATPREVNAVLRGYADELNGRIDRDNIQNKDLTRGKFIANAFRRVVSYPEPGDTWTPVTITLPKYTLSSGWVEVAAISIDTAAAWLDIDINATATGTVGTKRTVIQYAISVDDVIVTESPCEACHYNSNALNEAYRCTHGWGWAGPVGPGAHRVRLLANVHIDGQFSPTPSISTVSIDGAWVCAVEHGA